MNAFEAKIAITQPQAHKLAMGIPVQFRADQLGHGMSVPLSFSDRSRYVKALRNGRGFRLQIVSMGGEGIFDWLKNAGSWVKKNVIDTPFYQKAIRPVAKELVRTGVETFVPGGIARDAVSKGTEFLSEKTGAFGIRKPAMKKKPTAKKMVPRAAPKRRPEVQYIGQSPAMDPIAPQMPDWSYPNGGMSFRGGSFRGA